MMKLNQVITGVDFLGTTIKKLNVDNNIVDVRRDAKRSFGLNINEPHLGKLDDGYYSEMLIDFQVEIEQSEEQKCKIEISLEGAFASKEEMDEEEFKQLVALNGAAALIGIARGKIETISANIFNDGKIVIPFVNVIDYYKDIAD